MSNGEWIVDATDPNGFEAAVRTKRRRRYTTPLRVRRQPLLRNERVSVDVRTGYGAMMTNLKRFVVIHAIGLPLVVFGAVDDVRAQATPTAPGTAAAAERCDVPSRDARAMANLLASPVAQEAPRVSTVTTEEDLPAGEPLDDETLAAVETTMRQFISCANAGAVFRSLNLVTDAFLRAQLGAGTASPHEIAQFSHFLRVAAEASPTPRASSEQVILVDLREGRLLDDGRAGVVVSIRSGMETAPVERGFYIFQRLGNRWLIDAVIAIVGDAEATPAF